MKYKYLYQTKSNENREGWISARNRAEAYAALRKQGIRPYRVIGDDPVRWQPWAVGACVALALALAAFAAIFRGRAAAGTLVLRRQQLTGDSAVISAGLETGWRGVFETKLDAYLAAYAQPGWIAIPPDVTEDDIAKFELELSRPDEMPGGDNAETRLLRRIVLGMRAEMRAYLASGGSVKDYLSFLEDRQDEELSFRKSALDLVEGASAQERDRVRMNMNVRLREMGLPELGAE